ncbi:MAG: ABC transporter ATP-binding protein [Methylococcaceae bacterium]|nr:ABC transporter ATP-binding protein [Methylococcaceae bacterium]
MKKMIELSNVSKAYLSAEIKQIVLNEINLIIDSGEFVAIVGASGNGKSTLLNLLTGIDQPSSGEIFVNNSPLHKLSGEKLTAWRCANVGIVFQFFQLLPALSLFQNIVLPMDFLGRLPKRQRRERAMALLDRVGLANEAHRLPSQVSGGQQQRAAIARALANDPELIVADEPTGNLDENTADAVFALFSHLRDQGKTLVMVTHNEILANAASRKIEIHAGRIHTDSAPLLG